MSREVHVRFCESAGVRFPRATHLNIVFSNERDARRVLAVLPKRFGRYDLQIHPEKTRLVTFMRPPAKIRRRRDYRGTWPGTFDFLGFTHDWARAQRSERWVIKKKTAKDRLSRARKQINGWCRQFRHSELEWQHRQLVSKLRGHYAYYGVTGNSWSLHSFYRSVCRAWKRWLSRRSYRAWLTWDRFYLLLRHYPLPTPVIVHSIYRK